MQRPADMFDRQWEWEALTHFVGDQRRGASLGVVSGRRRQGKSFLLQCLCEVSGGFWFEAVQAAETETLRHLGEQLGQHLGTPGRLAFESWSEALEALLDLSETRPKIVVLDEFPYIRPAPSTAFDHEHGSSCAALHCP